MGGYTQIVGNSIGPRCANNYSRTVIQLDHPASKDCTLTQVHCHSDGPGRGKVKIFRDDGTNFVLVCETSISNVAGDNTHNVSLHIKKGDYIAYYFSYSQYKGVPSCTSSGCGSGAHGSSAYVDGDITTQKPKSNFSFKTQSSDINAGEYEGVNPAISSLRTTPDPPKLYEPIKFLNDVVWNDAGGAGERSVSWQYTTDTAEYDGCGNDLSWTQFATEQWPTHTFEEDNKDIARIRCIVVNKNNDRDCAMIDPFEFSEVERSLYQVAWDVFITGTPTLVATQIVIGCAKEFVDWVTKSFEDPLLISPTYGIKSVMMQDAYWLCKNACDSESGSALSAAIVKYRRIVTVSEKALEDDREIYEEEDTYIEFKRETETRRIELTIFEKCLEGLTPTGDLHCTSNTDFFYVDIDGVMAGFSYANKSLVFKVPTGETTVKIYKEGYKPSSCTMIVLISKDYATTVDCKMVEEGECSYVTDVKMYLDPLWIKEDETVSFNGDADSGDPITSWEWDFGDGYHDEGQAVTHRYDRDGIYKVELVVTNDCGNDGSTRRNVVVSEEEEEEPLNESTTLQIETPIGTNGQDIPRSWEVEIWVDGKYTDCNPPKTLSFGTDVFCDCTAPWNLVPCGLGTHTITLKKEGYDDKSVSVHMEADTPKIWHHPVMVVQTLRTISFRVPIGSNAYVDGRRLT